MIVTVFITQRDLQHLASPIDDDGDGDDDGGDNFDDDDDDDGDDDGAPAGIE